MADSKADAPFVFEGSVKAVPASNVSAVPADRMTAVVQIDHVRHAPRALAGFAGKEITLRMAPAEKLAAGDKAVFFTDSLVFADHLAVQSMGHDPVVAGEARAAVAGAGPVVQGLRRRIDQAQSVVSGQVTEVRPSAPTTSKATATRALAAPSGFISEHDPFWHDAVIEVTAVHKGPALKKVVVRFPSSTDVKWRKAPRFTKGQKGTWLLHAGAPAPVERKATAAARAVAKPAGFYTALDPNDFHPAAEASVVRAMLPLSTSPRAAKRKSAAKAAVKRPAAKRAVARPVAKAAGKKGRS